LKKLAVIIVIGLLINSCVDEKTDDYITESSISNQEFQEIIKKIWLANAHIYNNKKFTLIPRDSLKNLTFQLLKEKEIDRSEFEKTIQYYSQNPTLLDSIIKNLRDSLEKVFISIPHEEVEEREELIIQDSLKDLLKESSKFKNYNIRKGYKNLNSNKKIKKDSLNLSI
jgi:hypothetical protein|tara:strand:- start:8 stop:514 length:507 start_codon:yes stop_codon:yes gene_type:complete